MEKTALVDALSMHCEEFSATQEQVQDVHRLARDFRVAIIVDQEE